MTKASDNEFPSVLLDEQASAPTTPSTGFWRVYAKSDGLYIIDDAGSETGPLSTGGGGGTTFSGARVSLSSAFSVPDNTDTAVQWNTETFDTDDYHDNVTNNTRLTVPTDGLYEVWVSLMWDNNTVGGRKFFLHIDGGTAAGHGQTIGSTFQRPWLTGSGIYQFTADQYVECIVRHSGGSGREIATSTGTFFAIRRLRDDS